MEVPSTYYLYLLVERAQALFFLLTPVAQSLRSGEDVTIELEKF